MTPQKQICILSCLLVLCVSACLFSPLLRAGGGGRAPITVLSNGEAGGKSAEIVATIHKDNDMKLSPGEKGVFRVKNPVTGQNCITKNEVADDQAKIYGSCTSPVSGEIQVYIHFPDKVEDAYPYKVTFGEPGKTPPKVPVSENPLDRRASKPCNSGLVAYGWDEANGKSCDTSHFNSWTAYCNNGYREHIPLNNCMHANELSNYPEWKQIAESICANPACGESNSAAPAQTPAPTIVTPLPVSKPTGPRKVQYFLTETVLPSGGVELDVFMRAQVRETDGRLYMIPVAAGYSEYSNELEYGLVSDGKDPWKVAAETYGLNFQAADSQAALALSPQAFNKDTKPLFFELLKQENIQLSSFQKELVDRFLSVPERQMVVLITKPETTAGSWLPPLRVRGNVFGIQEYLYPVYWDTSLRQGAEQKLDFELGVASVHAFKAKNEGFTQHTYDFKDRSFSPDGSRTLQGGHLSQLSKSIDLGLSSAFQISRDYPENATVEQLPKTPSAPVSPEPDGANPGLVTNIQHRLSKWWQDSTQVWKHFFDRFTPRNSTSSPTPSLIEEKSFNYDKEYVEFSGKEMNIRINEATYQGVPKDEIYISAPKYQDYATHEMSWQENGREMRLHWYFARDDKNWWVSDIRTYDGQESGDWLYYVPEGQKLLITPLGQPFIAQDYCFQSNDVSGKLCFKELSLQPFTFEPTLDIGSKGYYLKPTPWETVRLDLTKHKTIQLAVVLKKTSDSKHFGKVVDVDDEPLSQLVLNQQTLEYDWAVENQTTVTVDGQKGKDQPCCGGTRSQPFPNIIAELTAHHPGKTQITVTVRDTKTEEVLAKKVFSIIVE